MARHYNDFSIDLVCDDLIQLVNKKSTSNRVAATAYEAYEVIKQLQKELKGSEGNLTLE